jgi:hypothetical protein
LSIVTNVRGFRGRRAQSDRVLDLDDDEFKRTDPRSPRDPSGSGPMIDHEDR